MTDRKPKYPHRVLVKRENGTQEAVTWEYADQPLAQGTPLCKATLLDDTTARAILPGVSDPTVNQALAALGQKQQAAASVTVTLAAAGWGSTAPYSQTVSVAGMTAAWRPGAPVAVPAGSPDGAALMTLSENAGYIRLIESGEGKLKFVCPAYKPAVTMTLQIPGVM